MSKNRDIADNLLKQKKYQSALQIYLDILHQYPSDGKVYQGIAQCYYGLNKYPDAFSASNEALKLDPNLAIPHLILAYTYHNQGQFNKALAEAQKAYDLSPELDDVSNCYGALLLGSGKLDASISVLKHTLEIHPESVLAHQNLAVAYREKRESKKYVEEMRLAFKYRRTLLSAVQLLIAYQQRYAFFLALLILAALFGALLTKSRILLVIPVIMVVQGLLADLKFIIDSRWRRNGKWKAVLFSLITDCSLGVVTYAVYLTLGSK